MLSAHIAPVLIAKAARPGISLAAGIVLCFVPDVLHVICIAFGVERLKIDERYSHTLFVVLTLSAIVYSICIFLGITKVDSLIYAVIVISHYLLDLINRRWMNLTPWGPSIRGFGLHEINSMGGRLLSFIVEMSIVLISAGVYALTLYDGDITSLRMPALIFGIMLILEAFYFRIYFPDVRSFISRFMRF